MAVGPLKRTPLFELHKGLGARMVHFGGWEMPVRFSGINDEHIAVRTSAGLFDASHMGEIRVKGEGVIDFLQRVTCSDVERRKEGQAQYTALLNEPGGIIDDIIYYRISDKEFFLCVNAANTEMDFKWLNRNNLESLDIIDETEEWAQLALQGPKALEILEKVSSRRLGQVRPFSFIWMVISGVEVLAARTGYTGEDGFELFIPAHGAVTAWNELLEAGESHGLKPCGLGARDTLRLEMGYPLHGHDIAHETTPLDADLEWIVAWEKTNFIGRDALKMQKQKGPSIKRIGLEMVDQGIPREGCIIKAGGLTIGQVTSGTKTPCLKKPIAMGYIQTEYNKFEAELMVKIRGKLKKARIKELPFYDRKNPCL
jgi:aminomethyltransferase